MDKLFSSIVNIIYHIFGDLDGDLNERGKQCARHQGCSGARRSHGKRHFSVSAYFYKKWIPTQARLWRSFCQNVFRKRLISVEITLWTFFLKSSTWQYNFVLPSKVISFLLQRSHWLLEVVVAKRDWNRIDSCYTRPICPEVWMFNRNGRPRWLASNCA